MKVSLKDILKLKSKNIPLVWLSIFFSGMILFLPIIALYLQKSLFTLTNVSILFAVGTITSALLQVPTGAFADIYGRKKSMFISLAFLLFAIFFLYIGKNMFLLVIYVILNSLSKSFFAGADSSLIYDTLKKEKKESYFKKVNGTGQAIWPLGASIGGILGGYIAAYSLDLTVILSLIPVSIALITVLFIKEPQLNRKTKKRMRSQMWESAKFVLNNKQILLILFGMFILFGLGEGIHFLTSVFFQFKDIPIVAFGYLSAVSFALSALGHYYSHELSEKFGNKRTILISICFSIILIAFSTLAFGYIAAFAYILGSVFFGIRNPVLGHLVNIETPSNKRATVASISVLLIDGGIAIFAPIVGWLAQTYTINTSYMISSLAMVLALILFAFIKDKK